jgi:hypothetical protein
VSINLTPSDEQVAAIQKELNDVCVRHNVIVWAVGTDGGSVIVWVRCADNATTPGFTETLEPR